MPDPKVPQHDSEPPSAVFLGMGLDLGEIKDEGLPGGFERIEGLDLAGPNFLAFPHSEAWRETSISRRQQT
jgi:hypothetical protein